MELQRSLGDVSVGIDGLEIHKIIEIHRVLHSAIYRQINGDAAVQIPATPPPLSSSSSAWGQESVWTGITRADPRSPPTLEKACRPLLYYNTALYNISTLRGKYERGCSMRTTISESLQGIEISRSSSPCLSITANEAAAPKKCGRPVIFPVFSSIWNAIFPNTTGKN